MAGWAVLKAFNAEWIDPGENPPPGDIWRRSDVGPEPGQTRLIHMSHPRDTTREAPFWVIFMPAKASENGWASAPESIPESAFALCHIEEVVQQKNSFAWIRVRIDDAIRLSDLENRFAPVKVPIPQAESHQTSEHACFEDWEVVEGNTEGDLGVCYVAHRRAGTVHLLVEEHWLFDEDNIYAGHLELSEEQWQSFREI
jgi:hypothetical protein